MPTPRLRATRMKRGKMPVTDHTERRLQHLEALRGLVDASRRLKKVFTSEWFDDVKAVILRARGEPGLELPTHPAFIGYLHDAVLDPARLNLLTEVDEALDSISETARRTLSDKLRMVPRGTDDYVSAVFEILVVQKFVGRGLLVEYEPNIGSGRPEAKVKLGGDEVLIEARATLDSTFARPATAFDPKDLGLKLAGKILEKCQGQLRAATLPVVLFLGLNVNLRFEDAEIGVAWEAIAADASSAVLSAIVLSDDFRARRFELWRHPMPTMPLADATQEELRRVLDL
jgi:hypothetical protein